MNEKPVLPNKIPEVTVLEGVCISKNMEESRSECHRDGQITDLDMLARELLPVVYKEVSNSDSWYPSEVARLAYSVAEAFIEEGQRRKVEINKMNNNDTI